MARLVELLKMYLGTIFGTGGGSPKQRLRNGMVFAVINGVCIFAFALPMTGFDLRSAALGGGFAFGIMALAALLAPGYGWISAIYEENERRHREQQAARAAASGAAVHVPLEAYVRPTANSPIEAGEVSSSADVAPESESAAQVARDLLQLIPGATRAPRSLRATLAFTIGVPTLFASIVLLTSGGIAHAGPVLIFWVVGAGGMTGAALLARWVQRRWIQPLLAAEQETDQADRRPR